jgi:uncharacterized protein (DUF427 family)
VIGEHLVTHFSPPFPSLVRIVRFADLGIQGEDSPFPIEKIEDALGRNGLRWLGRIRIGHADKLTEWVGDSRMKQPQRIEVRPGQESVWDYPRPPRVEPSKRKVTVIFGGVEIAKSDRALSVLETAGPPTYYVPEEDVRLDLLVPVEGTTLCEWKGNASYLNVLVGDHVARRAAWTYPDPSPGYEAIKDYIAFYPGRVDACYLDDELVQPQPGRYYGGWITKEIVGPFKGEPGTEGW